MTTNAIQLLREICTLAGGSPSVADTELVLWRKTADALGSSVEVNMHVWHVIHGICRTLGELATQADTKIVLLRRLVTVSGGTWTNLDTEADLLQTIVNFGGL
jgi:hypothetical protein